MYLGLVVLFTPMNMFIKSFQDMIGILVEVGNLMGGFLLHGQPLVLLLQAFDDIVQVLYLIIHFYHVGYNN